VPRIVSFEISATLEKMEDEDVQEWWEQLRRELAVGREFERSKEERCHVHTSTLICHRFGTKVIVEPADH
jgi:hypothetical protein